MEVLAHPADSATRAATAAFDSLDARFARVRAQLDGEAAALRNANRLDSAYAKRYDAFESRRKSAVELRDARDRARRVRDSLAAHAAAAPAGKP